MDGEITSGAMQKLLGVGKVQLNELAKEGIACAARSAAPTG
jgi:hypothetical protein